MTLLRVGLVLLLLGGVAPAALVALVHPAQAEEGGGDSDGGGDADGESDSDDDAEEATEEEVRARQAAPARGPDFSTLTTGHIPNQTVTVTQGASRFP